ncbi:contractile injection system tape measure protein [Aquimarina longa]|uniref:contractile injection system tape measure protein n=1 Tax=Aquimarina longa TaxID=1080221 RepID=UPI000783400F|nr:contractile injection system tape measure protein [Aquimarina longa]
MSSKNIVIQKLKLDIYMDEHPHPQEFLNKSTTEMKESVMPLVLEQLKNYDFGKQNLAVDSIALTIKRDSFTDWTTDISKAITDKIVTCINPVKDMVDTNTAFLMETGVTPHSKTKRIVDIMQHFLTHGTLPWWKTALEVNTYRDLEKIWLDKKVTLKETLGFAAFLKNYPQAITRFVRQASPVLLNEWVRTLTDQRVYRFINILLDMTEEKENIYKPIIQYLVVQRDQTIPLTKWIAIFPVFLKNNKNATAFREQLQIIVKKVIPEKASKAHHFLPELRVLLENCNQEQEGLASIINKTEITDDTKDKTSPVEAVYTDYAGIVLLNPFFPSLFKNLGYLDKKYQWVNEASQVEAIYLLHYLTSGNERPTEDEVFVAKLLVGYPLDEVLPVLDKKETELFSTSKSLQKEMDALLEAIHQNWKPMRNCTWAGLQNDFLKRSAKVSQTTKMQYVLTITPHALDILLPLKKWGISMIKYSWMEDMLHVEWK